MSFEYTLEATALGDQEPTRIRLAKVYFNIILYIFNYDNSNIFQFK